MKAHRVTDTTPACEIAVKNNDALTLHLDCDYGIFDLDLDSLFASLYKIEEDND